MEAAAADAKPGEVVLLSPACASFDAFKDFEERGDRFRELVEALLVTRRPRRKSQGAGAAARVLPAADGDALPARLRGGDGVQRQLGALAAQPRRQRLLLPGAHADLRRDRPGGDAGRRRPRRAPPSRSLTPLHPRRRAVPALRGAGARRRAPGERLAALDRRRPPPVPALRAGEARAGPLRGLPAREGAEARHDPRRPRALPADRRPRAAADHEGARPRDLDRRLASRSAASSSWAA